MTEPPPLVRVDAIELRRLFNDGRYRERALQGEFTQMLRKDGHPSAPAANEPFCTRSQIIAYVDGAGQRVAIVHQYLRRDGSLGASGLPDPKRLLLDGVLYAVLEPRTKESRT